MNRIKKLEEFEKLYLKKIKKISFEDAKKQISIREYFLSRDIDFEEEDFFTIVCSLLREEFNHLAGYLINLINTPANYNEFSRIDFEFVSKRRKEIIEKYTQTIYLLRKLEIKYLKKECDFLEKEFEEYFKELKELKKYTATLLEENIKNLKSEVKQIDSKKTDFNKSMYI